MHSPSICAVVLLAQLQVQAGSSLAAIPQARERIQAAAKDAGVGYPLAVPEIRIFKAAHRLELWASGKRVKAYKAGLGHRGLADKQRSGDHLTPEGRFYLCVRNAQSAYHLFLGISYPGDAAATQGFRDGVISTQEREAILRANRRKACPPWNTGLGGTVGIHGHGASSDWTWGCVALEDNDVDELWVSCPLGTPILISP